MLKHLQKCCITLDVTGVKFEVVTLSEFETSRDVTKLLDVATPFVLLLGVALRRNATGAVATLFECCNANGRRNATRIVDTLSDVAKKPDAVL